MRDGCGNQAMAGGAPNMSLGTTPIQQIGAQDVTASRRAHTPSMRPLTAAYRVASSDHDVSPNPVAFKLGFFVSTRDASSYQK